MILREKDLRGNHYLIRHANVDKLTQLSKLLGHARQNCSSEARRLIRYSFDNLRGRREALLGHAESSRPDRLSVVNSKWETRLGDRDRERPARSAERKRRKPRS